jgi:hypothetical protein
MKKINYYSHSVLKLNVCTMILKNDVSERRFRQKKSNIETPHFPTFHNQPLLNAGVTGIPFWISLKPPPLLRFQ